MHNVLPLPLLRNGDAGEVVAVSGNETLVSRLAENGIRAGTQLEMIRSGDPSVVRVDETRMSLRCNGQIEVLVALAARNQ